MSQSKYDKEIIKLKLSDIVPYWRNPRDNSRAIEKVKESIDRFDYLNPLIVDKKNVIISGHTRFKALLQLGYDEIDAIRVDMPEREAKAFRIVDNKTSEFSEWTPDLQLELREIADDSLLNLYFPELKLDEMKTLDISDPTNDEIQNRGERLETQYSDADQNRADEMLVLTCPHCYQDYEMTRNTILENKTLEKRYQDIR